MFERKYKVIHNLKYGCNPHQDTAMILDKIIKDNNGKEIINNNPFKILNGEPGYINILDAINGWYLVNEIRYSINKLAAASFKHVSPAGVSIGDTICDAYKNARDCDPKSSFGDFIAVNSIVTIDLANFIKTRICDGIIAPEFDNNALEILKTKKKGNFIIIKGNHIDFEKEQSDYNNKIEIREIINIVLAQKNNAHVFTQNDLTNIPTYNKQINNNISNDLIIANITLKYTQSNSVCFVYNGMTIGIGAGQQSRIDCVKIAKKKAELYLLRKHPRVIDMDFKHIKYQDRINAILQFIENDMSVIEEKRWKTLLNIVPDFLSNQEKKTFIDEITKNECISMGSDAFFPFRDSIDQASIIGTKYISQPGGSIADNSVIEACNQYKMVMCLSNIREFHH